MSKEVKLRWKGLVEEVGFEKSHDFQPTSRFISEMVQGRAILTVAVY